MEDDKALEARIRTRMAFEKAKADFMAADGAGQDLVVRLRSAVAGMTERKPDSRPGDKPKLAFNPNNPNAWLAELPTAEGIRSQMTQWWQARMAMLAAHRALDPQDAREVRLPDGIQGR